MREGTSSAADRPVGVTGDPAQGSEPASVHVIVGATRARIVLSGEIDAELGADLQEATAAAEDSGLPVEIDAHHVTFMDSSGVAFLARLASRGPHRVRVLRAPPTVRFLLEVTRIGELLDIVDADPGFDLGKETEGDDTSGAPAPA
ncbi:STAS domain-containing protein [Cellulosimicrobium sp. CUA-896]|uniref:STAS domain-containing protein n=1 Tax=Cellulosimicrobium sp. CUA-896 TaxID=1517881 RepID=UPI0009F965A2|nr:STAS domain-containing protein [Cellulosimicrobium sp. CUA-896]